MKEMGTLTHNRFLITYNSFILDILLIVSSLELILLQTLSTCASQADYYR